MSLKRKCFRCKTIFEFEKKNVKKKEEAPPYKYYEGYETHWEFYLKCPLCGLENLLYSMDKCPCEKSKKCCCSDEKL